MADNLWALREQKKLSVAALANRAGLPIGIIIEYESGQRSIDPRHLSRLARALYVEESELRLHSDPRPDTMPREERPAPREVPPAARQQPARQKERPPRLRPQPRPPGPARATQITHIANLLQRLGRTESDLEAETGRPMAQLDRQTATDVIKSLQAQVAQANLPNRHRAYLPESVDKFEAEYLTNAQQSGKRLEFTLFDGSHTEGQLIGFGPYTLTIRQADGSELTLNKLALVSYRQESSS